MLVILILKVNKRNLDEKTRALIKEIIAEVF